MFLVSLDQGAAGVQELGALVSRFLQVWLEVLIPSKA